MAEMSNWFVSMGTKNDDAIQVF